MSTLIIRFIGVFVVLAIWEIGIILSGKIIRFLEHRPSRRTSARKDTRTSKGH